MNTPIIIIHACSYWIVSNMFTNSSFGESGAEYSRCWTVHRCAELKGSLLTLVHSCQSLLGNSLRSSFHKLKLLAPEIGQLLCPAFLSNLYATPLPHPPIMIVQSLSIYLRKYIRSILLVSTSLPAVYPKFLIRFPYNNKH